MIFFSSDKLKKYSVCSPGIEDPAEEFKHILYYITYKPMPTSPYLIRWLRYQTIDWTGESFLLNPEQLLDNWHLYKKKELMQYVFVAARRKYADYKLFGITTIDTINVNTEVLRNNRLLTITGDKIYFKYEELKWL